MGGGEQPPGCNANSLGAALVPLIEGAPVMPQDCVLPGQQLQYFVNLFVSPNDPAVPQVIFCDAIGGQVAVTFPNWMTAEANGMAEPGQYVPTAGYPFTPVTDIPQFGNADGAGMSFVASVPELYTVDMADVDEFGFLRARVDYGQTAFLDAIGETQLDGTVLTFPEQQGTATVSNAVAACQPEITLEKSALPDQVCEGQDTTVTYTYLVTNTSFTVSGTGTLPDLTNVVLTDDTCMSIMGPFGDDGDNLLNPGETWEYECTQDLSAETTNTAEVSANAIAMFPTTMVIETVTYTDTAEFTVTTLPLPTPMASNNGPVCEGDPVQLFAQPDGLVSYTWTGPAGYMSNEQNPIVDPAVAGEYCVEVVDENGCIATACTTVVLEVCTAACCFPDGTCEDLTQDDCNSAGGTYQGDGTSCDTVDCPQPKGACCLVDGSCTVVLEDECLAQDGVYQGDLTTCADADCPQPTGACCAADGSCLELTQAECADTGGTYLGDFTVCDPNPCPQPKGACCLEDGTCLVVLEDECLAQGGTYQGDSTDCDPNECPQPNGACCFPDGACEELTQADCQSAGGTWSGADTVCEPNECPQPPGACCFPDGFCTQVTEERCAGDGGLRSAPRCLLLHRRHLRGADADRVRAARRRSRRTRRRADRHRDGALLPELHGHQDRPRLRRRGLQPDAQRRAVRSVPERRPGQLRLPARQRCGQRELHHRLGGRHRDSGRRGRRRLPAGRRRGAQRGPDQPRRRIGRVAILRPAGPARREHRRAVHHQCARACGRHGHRGR
jgi:hypothetical protein